MTSRSERSPMQRRSRLQSKTPLRQGTKGLTTRRPFACAECGTLIQRARVGAGLCRACSQRRNAALRGSYARQGADVACVQCGRAFYASPYQLATAKYCSRECMGRARRRTFTCAICKADFESVGRPRRRTCGPRCSRELRRRNKLGAKNPMYRNASGRQERWREAREEACRCCGSRTRLTLHHVVYEQHVRRAGGDPFDPDDSLTVCFSCHMAHHHGVDRRIRVSQLRPENLAFARALFGEYADDYIARYYDGSSGDEPWFGARVVPLHTRHLRVVAQLERDYPQDGPGEAA